LTPRITSAKLLAVGTTVVLVGAAVAVAIWQTNLHGFSRLPGFWAAVAVFAVGAILMLVGVLKRDVAHAAPQLGQRAGDDSTQYQAGRDLHLGSREEER
jgi:hypothetical protein